MEQLAVAIVNSKGGVGKTSTAVCLGGALVERGRRVLLVDLDPQASASLWLGVSSDGADLLGALVEKDRDLVPLVCQLPSGLDLIPSGLMLTQFDPRTTQRPGRDFLVRQALKRLPSHRWDYVLFDTPGAFGILAINALAAADYFLIPAEAATLSVEPLLTQLQTIDEARDTLNPTLRCAGILPCRVNMNAKNPFEIVRLLRESFGDEVFHSFIRHNVNLAEAPAHKTHIAAYMSGSNGAADYRRMAAEFEERLGRATAHEARSKEVAHG